MNTWFLKTASRIWSMEIVVSGINFFILMPRFYEPRWGAIVAHPIETATRMGYLCGFGYLLLQFSKDYKSTDLIPVGVFGVGLTLLFEWGGIRGRQFPDRLERYEEVIG